MKFGTILADPPWAYQRTTAHEKLTGYADQQYPLLDTNDLRHLPIADIAADDSVLALWSPWPHVPSALSVITAWGFQYVTGLTWLKVSNIEPAPEPFEHDVLRVKPHYGVGYWMRGATELVLIGKRGSPLRERGRFIGFGADDTLTFVAHQVGHSRKPLSVHQIAEAEWPEPRIELFARRGRDGWTTLGYDLDSLDIRESINFYRGATP